jgi:transcriptional regulator/type VI secretion system activator RovC-like protein
MPDWRNPDDYAYLEGCNLHEWAWEFLRRNPKFRDAYKALAILESKAAALEEEGWGLSLQEIETWRALQKAAAEPWGLSSPANPELSFREVQPTFKNRAGVEILSFWETNENENWPGYPDVVALKFDLNYEVEISLEIAAEHLRRFSRHLHENFRYRPRAPKKTRRLHRSNFLLYVRILDAELAGATDGQITNALFSGNVADPRRSMTKARETARRMAADGYRELLLLPPHAGGPLGETKSPDD